MLYFCSDLIFDLAEVTYRANPLFIRCHLILRYRAISMHLYFVDIDRGSPFVFLPNFFLAHYNDLQGLVHARMNVVNKVGMQFLVRWILTCSVNTRKLKLPDALLHILLNMIKALRNRVVTSTGVKVPPHTEMNLP